MQRDRRATKRKVGTVGGVSRQPSGGASEWAPGCGRHRPSRGVDHELPPPPGEGRGGGVGNRRCVGQQRRSHTPSPWPPPGGRGDRPRAVGFSRPPQRGRQRASRRAGHGPPPLRGSNRHGGANAAPSPSGGGPGWGRWEPAVRRATAALPHALPLPHSRREGGTGHGRSASHARLKAGAPGPLAGRVQPAAAQPTRGWRRRGRRGGSGTGTPRRREAPAAPRSRGPTARPTAHFGNRRRR